MKCSSRGEFLDRPKKLRERRGRRLERDRESDHARVYHYNFTIDGVRTIDPFNPQLKTGSTASTITSVLEMRHPRPRSTTRSRCRMAKFARTGIIEVARPVRRLTVYTPPVRQEPIDAISGALSVPRRQRRRERVVSARPGESHSRQPARRRHNQAVHRRHAVRIRRPPNGPQADNTAKFGKDLIEDVIPYIERFLSHSLQSPPIAPL